jgi:energy-coupling factor transporter ATP-binding protein EcfA2
VKITRISLQSFRAFDEPFELDLDGGKNLLLHGENGSGKSSINVALKRFFEERGDDIARHRNYFSPSARTSYVRVHIKGKDAAGGDLDQDFQWDVADGHPLPVPKDPTKSKISKELRSLLVDGARRAGFLDYRMMLRTHLLSNALPRANRGPEVHDVIYGAESKGLEAQLFDLVSLMILAGVRVTIAGGGETTIGVLMREVWGNRPLTAHRRVLASANAHAAAFNQAFNAKLPELETKLAEFLNYFPNHQLSITFQPISLAWGRHPLELTGAELIQEIVFRGKKIADHYHFLNEARLSALATCLFLAGVFLSDNDYANPAYPRFLVLDDALIGLDLQNRLPVLRILTSDTFKNYQIFLLTHDRVWFDLARGHLREQDGWLHRELLADETSGKLIPRGKLSQADLERAKAHLKDGDLMAAAVYARAAFEWKLKNVCEGRGIEIKFKKDNKEISADDLWKGIVVRQRKREELRKTRPTAPDFISLQLERDVDAMRSTVLNQLSHAGTPGLKQDDVRDALKTVEALHDHNFPNA